MGRLSAVGDQKAAVELWRARVTKAAGPPRRTDGPSTDNIYGYVLIRVFTL
jgi:hypothetical protein